MRQHWHLRRGDFFDDIPEERAAFLAQAARRELPKNAVVFFEGDPGTSCYYVASGLLRIFSVTGAGKEPIFFLRKEGEMFGLSEVLEQAPRKANAQTLTPTVLYTMESEQFSSFLEKNFVVARRVITQLGGRVRRLGDHISSLMTCSVMARVVKLLVYIAYDNLSDSGSWEKVVTLPLRITQEQIASMTGSTQPTVSELLRQLQREQLIEVSRKEIRIINPLALLEKAELRMS